MTSLDESAVVVTHVGERDAVPLVLAVPRLELERGRVLNRDTLRRQVPLSAEVEGKRSACNSRVTAVFLSYSVTRHCVTSRHRSDIV